MAISKERTEKGETRKNIKDGKKKKKKNKVSE